MKTNLNYLERILFSCTPSKGRFIIEQFLSLTYTSYVEQHIYFQLKCLLAPDIYEFRYYLQNRFAEDNFEYRVTTFQVYNRQIFYSSLQIMCQHQILGSKRLQRENSFHIIIYIFIDIRIRQFYNNYKFYDTILFSFQAFSYFKNSFTEFLTSNSYIYVEYFVHQMHKTVTY